MEHRSSRIVAVASPIAVIALSYAVARILIPLLGRWTWAGVFPVYWGSMLLVTVCTRRSDLKLWFVKPAGSLWWAILAVVVGVIAVPLLLIPNLSVLKSLPLAFAWLAFGIVNSICEELYWRGLLLDATSHLARPIGIAYSSVLFIVVHPLVFGTFARIQAFDRSKPLALLPFLSILAILSVVWSLMYTKTRSLRWPILSHFLTDLGNLSVFVFMNMVNVG